VTEHPPPPPLWGLSAWTQRLKNNRTKRRFSGLLARLKGESLLENKNRALQSGGDRQSPGNFDIQWDLVDARHQACMKPVPKSVGLSKNISACPKSVKAEGKKARDFGSVKGCIKSSND
jgi:hypothetical protein